MTTLRVVDFNITSSAKLDGNDYPATGPTVPAKFTLAIKRKGPRSCGFRGMPISVPN